MTSCSSHVLANRFAVDCEGIAVNQIAEIFNHSRQPTRVEKILHQVFSGRHQVYKTGNAATESIPVVECQFNSDSSSDREQMNDRVRGTANCSHNSNGILESSARQDLRHAKVFVNHLDYSLTRHVCQRVTTSVDGRNRCVGW